MAGLTWADVVIIGAVATVGFTLLSFWYSGVMARRNWSYQVKSSAKKPEPVPAQAAAPAAKSTAKATAAAKPARKA